MLPSCCHCRSCAHFLSVRHCRLKACWSIMLTNIMNYCTSKCCRHVLFNILESIRALSTPYPRPIRNLPPTQTIQSHLTKPSQRWSIIKALRPPASTSQHFSSHGHHGPPGGPPVAPQGTTERQTACKAFRMRGQAASTGSFQPLPYAAFGVYRERERIENNKTGQNESNEWVCLKIVYP